MVHDFLNIDYNMITTINTSAIQELYKIIKQQQQQIDNLFKKLSHLNKINEWVI